MKTILINHPQGVITLKELQEDVNIAQKKIGSHEFAFSTMTVQALIDKITAYSEVIEGHKSRETENKHLKEQLETAELERERLEQENESLTATISRRINNNEYDEQSKRLGL